MLLILRRLLPALLGALVSLPLVAQAGAPAEPGKADPKADPRVAIASKIPGAHAEDLRPSPVPGIYQLARGADFVYVTTDGKYAFIGDLYELQKNHNLTEEQRKDVRVRRISSIPESDMVVFGPRNPRYTVTVFTDVDCAYCRELHSQIAEYNRLGIKVRYLAYPRTGPNTDSWTKAEQVWCSPDRNDALTKAKRGQGLKGKVCPNNPVAREYALGREFQLEGTPAIVMADGELLPGYLPPDALIAHLKETQGR